MLVKTSHTIKPNKARATTAIAKNTKAQSNATIEVVIVHNVMVASTNLFNIHHSNDYDKV